MGDLSGDVGQVQGRGAEGPPEAATPSTSGDKQESEVLSAWSANH